MSILHGIVLYLFLLVYIKLLNINVNYLIIMYIIICIINYFKYQEIINYLNNNFKI